MARQKEMKFRDRGYTLEARRGNLIFYLYDDNTQTDPESRTYYVIIKFKGYDSLGMSTKGYRHFKLEDAKEFCQKIAAGEIDPEALLMEFAAEDMEKEQAAMREATEKAKKFHAKLEAAGISYITLLKLWADHYKLVDEMARNILLGYERGEGWPSGT